METILVGNLAAIIVLAVGVVWAGAQAYGIRTDLRRALRPTLRERIAHVTEQTIANASLVGEPSGRKAFFDYALSEAAIIAFAEEVEEQVQRNPEISIEELRRRLAEEDDRNALQRGWDWLVAKKGTIAEKVFGKVNSLLKGIIPGLGSKSDGGAV